MNLRRQLLLVSLLLLTLPWAGCQYLREMEHTLRQGQGMAAHATALALAAALREREDLLYPGGRRLAPGPRAEWYLPRAELPLIADGYGDDWRESDIPLQLHMGSGLTLRVATHGERLFLILEVDDEALRYARPDAGKRGDRLVLLCGDPLGALRRYTVSAEGPGLVRAQRRGGPDDLADRIRGAWRETAGGYTLELQAPLDQRCERMALNLFDASDTGETRRLDTRAMHNGDLPWLVYRINVLEDWLSAFAAPGRRIAVQDRSGWLVAEQSSLASAAAGDDGEVFWLLRLIYRTVLNGDGAVRDSAGQRSWRSESAADGSMRLVVADAGVPGAGEPLGSVSISETTERYLALTDRASTRVFAVSAGGLAIAFMGLLGYATVLSLRIRRLRDAAVRIAADPKDADAFPRSRAGDELGDLSRSYADLLDQVGEYNRYLRGLASTLSHELRTPIAVVGSSLDNLARPDIDETDRETYRQRAAEGLARLARIVAAMSEASRIEASLEGVAFETLDVAALLRDLSAAYSDSFDTHRFSVDAPDRITVSGSGELLAQAIDKLVDNAVSFAPAGTTIALSCRRSADAVQIEVSNEGPLLPDDLRERLFEPMVSVRESRGEDTHLGIGLHIARAVAERHGGTLRGANRPDGSGVVFTLRLPPGAS